MSNNDKEFFEYAPDYAVKPGDTIEEMIGFMGFSKMAFARHLGVSIGYLNRVISANIPLSVDFAIKLETVTKVPAAYWNSLEANYRTQLNRLAELTDDDRRWLKDQPRKDMIDRRWIAGGTELALFHSTLSFYLVADRAAWLKVWAAPLAAARISPKYKVSLSAVAAFVRAGEMESATISCKPYSTESFRAALADCRTLAAKTMTRETLREMRRLCAEAGVALVFVRSIAGAPLNGVTRWLSKDKAMILLSLRTGSEDVIWFSFFHEARHILDERKKTSFLTGQAWADSPDEKIADDYAAEMLLPKAYDGEVRTLRTMEELTAFAKQHNLSPSIVAGRFRHLTRRLAMFKGAFSYFSWNEGEWKIA